MWLRLIKSEFCHHGDSGIERVITATAADPDLIHLGTRTGQLVRNQSKAICTQCETCCQSLRIVGGTPVDMPHKEQGCPPAHSPQQQEPAVAHHQHVQEEKAPLEEARPAWCGQCQHAHLQESINKCSILCQGGLLWGAHKVDAYMSLLKM
jgi:hypothetical protein